MKQYVYRFYSHGPPEQTPEQKRDAVIMTLTNVLAVHEKVNPEKVTPSCHFIQDLGLDSLDLAEV